MGRTETIPISIKIDSTREPLEIPGLELLSEIGRGTSSTVYLAKSTTHANAGSLFAVKIMRDSNENSVLTNFRRIRKEACALARISHPGLIKMVEVGKTAGFPYLVMEYFQGKSLNTLIQGKGFQEDRVIQLAKKMANILTEVHKSGLIHCDIKPQNILMDQNGEVKLIDFGLVSQLEIYTQESSSIGTLLYSSPEQNGMLNRAVDRRSDLYSLGIVLFQTCTGQPPFNSEDVGDLLQQHASDIPPLVRQINPLISEDLSCIIAKLIAKDPDDRYQYSSSLAIDLEKIGTLTTFGSADANFHVSAATKMIGRGEDIGRLDAVLRGAQKGNGGLVLVTGSPGIGKSRLVHEFGDQAKKLGCEFLSGKFTQNQVTPLSPFKSVLEDYLTRIARMNLKDKSQLEQGLVQAAGEFAPLLKKLSPKMSSILKDTPDLSDSIQVREQFYDAISEFYLNFAQPAQPLLFILEDIQWIDESSLSVLKLIVSKAYTRPILIVCTARSDSQNEEKLAVFLEAFQQRMTLKFNLEDLSSTDSLDLISAYLGESPTEPELSKQVYLRAQGNPFALIQFLNAMLNEGLLLPSWGKWVLDVEGLSKLALPSDVAQLIANRVNHLQESTRRLLGVAALLGSKFSPRFLPEICKISQAKANQAIAEGMSVNVIELTSNGDFNFVHERAYEVLRDQFPVSEARRLHTQVAQAIDSAVNELPSLIFSVADHYNLGELEVDNPRIYESNFLAGIKAIQNYIDDAAYQYFKQVERIATTGGGVSTDRTLEFEEVFGELCLRLGKLDEGISHFEKGLESSTQNIKSAKLCGKLMTAWLYNGSSDKSWFYAKRAFLELGMFPPKQSKSNLGLALILGMSFWFYSQVKVFIAGHKINPKDQEKAKILADIANSARLFGFFQGKVGIAANLTLRTLHCSTWIQKSSDLVYLYMFQALLFSVLGISKLARSRMNKSIVVAQDIRDPIALGRSMFFRLNCLFILGDERKVTFLCASTVRDYSKWVNGDDFVMYTVFHHMSLLLRGKCNDLLEHNDRMNDYFKQKASQTYHENQGFLISFRTAGLAVLGRSTEAVESFKKAQEYFEDKEDYFSQYVVNLTCQAFFYLEQEEYGSPVDILMSKHQKLRPHDRFDMTDVSSFYIPQAYLRLGQWVSASPENKEEALVRLLRALGELKKIAGTALKKAHWQLVSASFERIQGNRVRALELLIHVERSALELDSPWLSFEVLKNKAFLMRDAGNSEGAQALAGMALNIAYDQGWGKRASSIKAHFDLSRSFSSGGAHLNPLIHSSIQNTSSSLATRESIYFRRKVAALMELSLASANVIDPVELARIALRETVRLLGGERALLFLFQEKTGILKFRVGRDSQGNELEEPHDFSRSIVAHVRVKKEPIVYTGSGQEMSSAMDDSIAAHSLRSVVATPLLLKDHFMGVLYLDSRIARGIFSSDDLEILRVLGSYVAISIETARTAQLQLEKKAFEKDMELTRAVQGLLLPKVDNHHAEKWKLAGFLQSAAQVGGDWWWFDEQEDGIIRVLVGDVTGHGAASAMVTAVVASSYQTIQTQKKSTPILDILKTVDQVLIQLCSGNYWMTMTALEINPKAHSVKWWSACAPPLFVSRKNGEIELVETDHDRPMSPLGTPQLVVSEKQFELFPGEKVLIFTDGLFEFQMENGEEFGLRRLKKLFASSAASPSAEVLRDLAQKKSCELVEKGALDDDITCVVLEML